MGELHIASPKSLGAPIASTYHFSARQVAQAIAGHDSKRHPAASSIVPTVANGDAMGEWTCNRAALERIIAAVGKKFTGDVDHDRLVFDLQDAWSKWLLFTALDSDKGARARKELFGAITESASNLRKHLLAPRSELDTRDDNYSYPAVALLSGRARFDDLVGELDRVITAAKHFVEQNSRGGWVRLSRPPKEWMAGEVLSEVYERNFHRRAAASRNPNTEKADGPYPRFAQAVMAEWGIKITRGVIVRALKEARKGLPRRKPRPTTLTRPRGW